MSVPAHHTHVTDTLQPPAFLDDLWETEVVPALPGELALQAQALGAFQRTRAVPNPTLLLRALLAYVLCVQSFRGLGAWAILLGLADLSDTAWRKRLRKANAWLLWLLGDLLAAPPPPLPLVLPQPRRVLLVDATRLKQRGGSGDDWRVHVAYDLTAGRLAQVTVTDRHGGEHIDHFVLAPGDIIVADAGYGYRRTVLTAQQAQADVVMRITPATCPLVSQSGAPLDVLRWVRKAGPPLRVWSGVCRWQGQTAAVRLVAAKLSAQAARAARHRVRRNAEHHGRTARPETLELAGWLFVLTTLDGALWSETAVLTLYRARWQVELVFKRLKQVLHAHTLRATTQASAEPMVRLLLLAWLVQEEEAAAVRAAVTQASSTGSGVLSSWLLTTVSMALVRQQVGGQWGRARLQACLPRLVRYLCASPRRRVHQETAVRAWLAKQFAAPQMPTAMAA